MIIGTRSNIMIKELYYGIVKCIDSNLYIMGIL